MATAWMVCVCARGWACFYFNVHSSTPVHTRTHNHEQSGRAGSETPASLDMEENDEYQLDVTILPSVSTGLESLHFPSTVTLQ